MRSAMPAARDGSGSTSGARTDTYEGRDPVAILAAAREEVGEVCWLMRAPWLLAKWFVFALGLVVSATLITAWFM